MRNGGVTGLQHLCGWGPSPCTCSMESVKGLCCLQQTHTRVQIQGNFRKWPFDHWHGASLGSAIRCVVRVESHAFYSFLSLHWKMLLSAWGISVWRTVSLHIQTSSSANKENLLRQELTVAAQTAVTMVLRNTPMRGKGRTDPLGGNFLFSWFDDFMWMMCFSLPMPCILSQWLLIADPALAELITGGKGELNAIPLRALLSQGSHNFSTALVSGMGRRAQSMK